MGFAGVCGAQKTKYKLDQYVLSPQLICSLSARTVLFNLCVLGGLEDETQSSTGIYTVRSHAARVTQQSSWLTFTYRFLGLSDTFQHLHTDTLTNGRKRQQHFKKVTPPPHPTPPRGGNWNLKTRDQSVQANIIISHTRFRRRPLRRY